MSTATEQALAPATSQAGGLLDISVDELYATFLGESAEDDEGCESEDCSRQAVFVIRWEADGRLPFEARCGCARVTKQCLDHGEAYRAMVRSTMVVECLRCSRFMLPHHIDRLRRTA